MDFKTFLKLFELLEVDFDDSESEDAATTTISQYETKKTIANTKEVKSLNDKVSNISNSKSNTPQLEDDEDQTLFYVDEYDEE